MRYVIAYDIGDDRRRQRVYATLDRVGDRMQGSVWELDVDATALADVLDRVVSIIDPAIDSILVYRVCASCVNASIAAGAAPAQSLDPFVIA
ncbi:MAG: CRISPR-associated endonuclease Cas2 [Patulibacter sp.]